MPSVLRSQALTLNFAPRCRIAARRIHQLNFGRREDPVLDLLRHTWQETKPAAQKRPQLASTPYLLSLFILAQRHKPAVPKGGHPRSTQQTRTALRAPA